MVNTFYYFHGYWYMYWYLIFGIICVLLIVLMLASVYCFGIENDIDIEYRYLYCN